MPHTLIATIDRNAIAANINLLKSLAPKADMACAVKANAYGMGAHEITRTLIAQGCKNFYVANVDEALELRRAFPDNHIASLSGFANEEIEEALANTITPVINNLAAWGALENAAKKRGKKAKAIVHIDTGMNRLGFSQTDWKHFCENRKSAEAIEILYIMSHLACSDEPHHPLNREQLEKFNASTAPFPHIKKSFANSCGVFLGADYHFDQCRVGRALYGTDLDPAFKHTLHNAVSLHAPILQTRILEQDDNAGYGASQKFKKGARLATIAAGYADGLTRYLSNSDAHISRHFYIGDFKVPVAGRVSMDLIILDISNVPEQLAHDGTLVELAGSHQSIDQLAAQAGTIGYELLTHIAPRVRKHYI